MEVMEDEADHKGKRGGEVVTYREKVIKGLECLATRYGICNGIECEYYDQGLPCVAPINDALVLLREQEPVKAVRFEKYNGYPVYFCGKCDKVLKRLTMNYCPNCGRRVDWNA